MSTNTEDYKGLPAIDKLLAMPEVIGLINAHSRNLVVYAVRQTIEQYRIEISQNKTVPEQKIILQKIKEKISSIVDPQFKKVINATGIIIHTNLGRAPLGKELLKKSFNKITGYNNLEFDLEKADRGNRNSHAAEILKYLSGAEDVIVVNNNAAALLLILRGLAKKKEVIVSRGELIEIGDSFRIPEIMAASDCKMVEIGTTNKTKKSDFQNAVTAKTALLFKAHKSNFIVKGFTNEVALQELAELGKENNIPVVYDLGSGLLQPQNHYLLKNEPDAKSAISTGIDLVCFSADKLLGGPQAGIIAGKKQLIDKLKKEPLFRALRVCKTTLAILETACHEYINENELHKNNVVYKTLHKTEESILLLAETLKTELEKNNIPCEILPNNGYCGGGTLPDKTLKSYCIKLSLHGTNKQKSNMAETMYKSLCKQKIPVVGFLKKGNIYFDMLCIFDDEIDVLSKAIISSYTEIKKH